MRESTVRGAAIDISDFERRLRGTEPAPKSPGDPLRELARLMQGEEQASSARRYDEMFTAEPMAREPAQRAPEWRRPAAPTRDALSPERRGAYAEPQAVSPSRAHAPQDPAPYQQAPADSAYYAGAAPRAAASHEHFAAAPDAHAQEYEDYWEDDGAAPQEDADPAWAQERPRFRLRPWHVVAAVAFLGAGGVAWSLGHNHGMIGSREIVTIRAPEGPAKVAPAVGDEGGVGGPEAAVLDRQENAQVKHVVSHQEQAVEPRVEPKTLTIGSGPVDAPHEAQVEFSTPKKVKTITVRPDGSMIEGGAVPPAIVKAIGVAPGDSGSTTPKAAAKTPTTPKTEKTAAVRPKPSPKQVDDEAAPASEAANEEGAPKHSGEKGGFAVQFGAPATEAEARVLMKQIASKYSGKLEGRKPTFKMAKVGDKTVYRVRIGGVSKETATSVCGKVKAGGGDCFVAGN